MPLQLLWGTVRFDLYMLKRCLLYTRSPNVNYKALFERKLLGEEASGDIFTFENTLLSLSGKSATEIPKYHADLTPASPERRCLTRPLLACGVLQKNLHLWLFLMATSVSVVQLELRRQTPLSSCSSKHAATLKKKTKLFFCPFFGDLSQGQVRHVNQRMKMN